MSNKKVTSTINKSINDMHKWVEREQRNEIEKTRAKANKAQIFWTGLCILTLIIMFFGMFWIMNISHASYTIQIKMDENTKDYLLTHDYCMIYKEEMQIVFIGDCEYSKEAFNTKKEDNLIEQIRLTQII